MPDLTHIPHTSPLPTTTPGKPTDTFDTNAAIGLASILLVIGIILMLFLYRHLRAHRLRVQQQRYQQRRQQRRRSTTTSSIYHNKAPWFKTPRYAQRRLSSRADGHADEEWCCQDSVITIESMSKRRESMFRYVWEDEKGKGRDRDRKGSGRVNVDIEEVDHGRRPQPERKESFKFGAWDFRPPEPCHHHRGSRCRTKSLGVTPTYAPPTYIPATSPILLSAAERERRGRGSVVKYGERLC